VSLCGAGCSVDTEPAGNGSAPRRSPGIIRTVDYSAPIGAASSKPLDRTFFALSDPTRRSILERLAAGPATIGDLAQPLGLTLNGVKKHVGILEEVDLVMTSKVGRSRECRLGPAELQDVTRWVDAYRRALERRLEGFGAYVEARTARDE
jgi:DNA-binding transcriptional ArsR family regulator